MRDPYMIRVWGSRPPLECGICLPACAPGRVDTTRLRAHPAPRPLAAGAQPPTLSVTAQLQPDKETKVTDDAN